MSETPNAADPVAQKESRITELQRRIQEENDIRAVLSTPEGRRLLVRILDICGRNTPYFHPNNSTMSEIAGRRSVAFQIENWVRDVDHGIWQAVDVEIEASRPRPEPVKPGRVKR